MKKKNQNKTQRTKSPAKPTSVAKFYLGWVDTMDNPERTSSTTTMDPNLFETPWHLQNKPHPSASKETICLESTLSYDVSSYKEVAVSGQWSKFLTWSQKNWICWLHMWSTQNNNSSPHGIWHQHSLRKASRYGEAHVLPCRAYKEVL